MNDEKIDQDAYDRLIIKSNPKIDQLVDKLRKYIKVGAYELKS